MGCLWSVCCPFCFGKCRQGKMFSCCTKKKNKTAELTMNDSLLRRQNEEDTDIPSICKPKTDSILKDEKDRSSQEHLEPEFLNCAAKLSLYKSTESFHSGSGYSPITDKRDLPEKLPSTERGSKSVILSTVTSDDQTSPAAAMDLHTKRTSGEWPAVDDGDSVKSNLPEHGKRSRLLGDPHISDGDDVLTPQASGLDLDPTDSLNSKQKDSLQSKGSCKNPPEGHAGERLIEPKSSDPLIETGSISASEYSSLHSSDGINTSKSTCLHKEGEKVSQSRFMKERGAHMDNEEDLYRDEKEIEEEKIMKVPVTSEKDFAGDHKLGVGPEMDIVEYCQKEWRGKTSVAKIMEKGYEEVSHCFASIRRIRGDNYCALRATLFQALSQTTNVPEWLNDDLLQLPEKLVKEYEWIKLWRFWHTHRSKKVWVRLKEYLELLKKKWAELSTMKIPEEKQAACDDIFRNEEEEYCLYEAVKFLMLKTAIDLYNANEEGNEVPVFSWLLFARNTSSNPSEFMKNHLNQVGRSGGLEQVEMFLLGYALQHAIRVYRLYKNATEEFITQYPNDKEDWPVVTLITEDDRHYNVPVRMCEETSF